MEEQVMDQGAGNDAAQPIGHSATEQGSQAWMTPEEVMAKYPDQQAARKQDVRPKPKAPRPAVTYRAQRRNEAKRAKKPMYRIGEEVKEGWSPAAELNRSPNWTRATSYSFAREISPCPERPVR